MAIERKINVDMVRVEVTPDQGWLPGTEIQKIESAHRLSVRLRSIQDEAMDLEREIENVCREHGIEHDFDIGTRFDLGIDDTDVTYGYVYEIDGITHETLIDALEAEMDLEIPGSKFYTYRFQRSNDNIMTSGSTHSFEELVEQAYYYPNQFSCTGTNDEEHEFIKSILAYKIAEKLKS